MTQSIRIPDPFMYLPDQFGMYCKYHQETKKIRTRPLTNLITYTTRHFRFLYEQRPNNGYSYNNLKGIMKILHLHIPVPIKKNCNASTQPR